ncbi:DEAD/DEAH box helicase family protein, partial [Akkermansiaceae bacterium]|nr:DEAD/DEAH box helicase family protein [Akkermansiaceae bacterium]
MNLEDGIYDNLLTQSLAKALDDLRDENKSIKFESLENELLPDYLSRSLGALILQKLRGSAPAEQYDIANNLVRALTDEESPHFIEEPDNLLSYIADSISDAPQRPRVPLSFSSLFTGSSGSPQLGNELELEFETADRIDFLVSFIKNSGLNLIYDALHRFVQRGGKLRVITTTYMGASDPTAIEKLSKLANTEVKVSYDTRSSRLHAKAYFVHRNSGLSSAYIGSANLSRPAITAGLEWTLKIPKPELPDLFRRCNAEFEKYWEGDSFESYLPGDLEKFTKASSAEKNQNAYASSELVLFELKPRDYQQAVLDSLQQARENRGHFRNLVVAATGTGKTLIAAFDYKRQCKHGEQRPKLLFLAHRKEILCQAQTAFRQVLLDGNFGDLLCGGNVPESYDYLFASVSSFGSKRLIDKFPVDYWDIVILDEAHHSEAITYRSILDELKPKILVGLTATPERGDGISIVKDFDFPLAAEIRLAEALEKKLLCPFHYYAISDNVDFSSVKWSRGKYDQTELSNLLTADDVRVGLIISKIIEYLPSPLQEGHFDSKYVKGLGFCVSKYHARFMSEKFNAAGIKSAHLDSESSPEDRVKIRHQLKKGELNFIFVVDLYNEGVDIPEVNTILFLRPTESHVIYLQQFGRGLRRLDDEKHLTVLDFIGECRKEFRFD